MGLKPFLAFAVVLWVVACASPLPEPIREAPPDNVGVAEVRADPDRFLGRIVRWGGTIASVNNMAGETRIEVVSRELTDEGRPKAGDETEGRFIALINGFLDPVVYATGRSITVYGQVDDAMTRDIGAYSYVYPVIDVKEHVLWKAAPERAYRMYDPFWYYDPFFPYRYYGYPYYWGP